MIRCETCDQAFAACDCDNDTNECTYRQAELTDFVWDFNMLVNVEEEEEVWDE